MGKDIIKDFIKLNLKHIENIYGKTGFNEDLEFEYSSVDDSNMSDSNFGCSEDEDLIIKSLNK